MTTPETPKRLELELPDGRKISIEPPPLPDFGEFCLPGNVRVYPDFVGFHDAAHDVGGTFRPATGGWTLNGPVCAADFWKSCVIMQRNQEALMTLADDAGKYLERPLH